MNQTRDQEDHSSCNCVLTSSNVSQTLDELDFERGLWSASMNGELDRVKELIKSGRGVNTLDSSGYSPLVSKFNCHL